MKQVNKESGNVLFLILIAVALFAALSYAVTQSTRSGAGSTDREQSLLGSASLTQYPTALRTAVVRMLLAGIDVKDLAFNGPANFTGTSETYLVFHPDGGGAVFQQPPTDVMQSGASGNWSHNARYSIPNIGRSNGDAASADLIAFLPNINTPSCQRVNQQMGISQTDSGCTYNANNIPTITVTEAVIKENRSYTSPATGADLVAPITLNCGAVFTGKATGCFAAGGADATALGNVFYSVIIER